jgi:hypothetical protein
MVVQDGTTERQLPIKGGGSHEAGENPGFFGGLDVPRPRPASLVETPPSFSLTHLRERISWGCQQPGEVAARGPEPVTGPDHFDVRSFRCAVISMCGQHSAAVADIHHLGWWLGNDVGWVRREPVKGSGRNGTCPCGSGAKVKRCCGTRRGPGPAELARAFLVEERRRAASALLALDRDELHDLFDEIVDLPTLDMSLQVDLPRFLTPELERLRTAIAHDDDEMFETAVDPAVDQLNTPERRAALAWAVLDLRDARRMDSHLAAVAVIDLGARDSSLFQSSVVEALAVSAGAARTPSGLLIVSR